MLRDILPGVKRDLISVQRDLISVQRGGPPLWTLKQDSFPSVDASAGERERAGVCGQGEEAAGKARNAGDLFLYNENFVELSLGAGRDGCCGTHTQTPTHTITRARTHTLHIRAHIYIYIYAYTFT
jgi:hypothetical protein